MKVIIFIHFILNAQAYADTIRMGVGYSKPPYIINEYNNGIEIDIIREALKFKGHTFRLIVVPQKRIPLHYSKNLVDGIVTYKKGSIEGVFTSSMSVTYENYAMTLEKNNLKIKSIKDLKNMSVSSFHGAKTFLGKEFRKSVDNSKRYNEVPMQGRLIKLLVFERAQVVVSDKRIFNYFLNTYEKEIGKNLKIKYHPIFPPSPYYVGFRNKRIRDDFNLGLKYLKSSGKYKKIFKKYSDL